MFAVSAAADRCDSAKGDRVPGRRRRENASGNDARDFAVPRAMAGMARPQAHRHLSSRISSAESQREGRSVERPAESDGGIGPAAAKEVKILLARRCKTAICCYPARPEI